MDGITSTTVIQPNADAPPDLDDRLRGIENWVNARRRGVTNVLFGIMLALSAIIAHLEIDRLIAGTLSQDGRSAPLGGVIGPLALAARRDARDIWNNALEAPAIGGWIIMAVVVDAVLIFAYFKLFSRAIRRCESEDAREAHLWALVGAEIAEGVCLVFAASILIAGGDIPSWLSWGIAGFATAKWILLATLLLGLFFDKGFRDTWARMTRQTLRAAWLHRLSTVLVVALFVLTCIPSDGVLDQLPDLQRQWSDGEHLGNLFAAVIAVVVAMLSAFVFGRIRVRAPIQHIRDAAERAPGGANPPGFNPSKDEVYAYPNPLVRARLDEDPMRFRVRRIDWWWFAPIAALFLAAIASVFLTAIVTGAFGLPDVHGWSVVIFVAIPVIVILASLPSVKAPKRWSPAGAAAMRARYGWLTGDLIAVLILCVVGLGLIRSFTGPVAAEIATDLSVSGLPASAVVLLILGAASAVGGSFLLRIPGPGRTSRFNPTKDFAPNDGFLKHHVFLGGILGFGIVVLFLIAVLPLRAAELLGAPALTIAVLTLWGIVLGAFTVALQEYPPLPIFVRLHLRATPVLTLAITIPLLAGIILASTGADDPQLHAVRQLPAGDASEFPDTSAGDLIDERLQAIGDERCVIRVDDKKAVRPVIVIAAEGGGIRAAYWTARVFEEMRAGNPCLANSVLLSSGVSGGSVGMAITAALAQAKSEAGGGDADADASEQDGFAPEACEQVGAELDASEEEMTVTECLLLELSSPEAVAAGTGGLLVRDQISGLSGLRFPAPEFPTDETMPDLAAADRAVLIEHNWIADIPPLGLTPNWAKSTAIGIPVFNSTDARTKCKVLVTPLQVVPDRGGGFDEDEHWDCVTPGESPSVLPVERSCFAQLDWAGIAMLSARFPTITPAARIPHSDYCGKEDLQLIDGGYAEGSALGTVADLAPLIVDRIGHANTDDADKTDSAETEAGPEGDDDAAKSADLPLVPILIYVKNSAGYDLRSDVAEVSAEPLVPFVGYSAVAKQLADTVLLQRISEAFEHTPGSEDAIADIEEHLQLPGLSVTVAPRTVPTIVPPLGWALSSYSQGSLEKALRGQLDLDHPNGTPTLKALIDAVKPETDTTG